MLSPKLLESAQVKRIVEHFREEARLFPCPALNMTVMYLCCNELFQTLDGHPSPQDSSNSGEAGVIPGGRYEKSQKRT